MALPIYFFLLFGCAKTEMVSEDNTVTNENIVSTTGTIVIETGTQDAIQPSTDQPPEATSEYKIIMVGDVLLPTPNFGPPFYEELNRFFQMRIIIWQSVSCPTVI